MASTKPTKQIVAINSEPDSGSESDGSRAGAAIVDDSSDED